MRDNDANGSGRKARPIHKAKIYAYRDQFEQNRLSGQTKLFLMIMLTQNDKEASNTDVFSL